MSINTKYRAYLQSEKWHDIVKQRFEIDNYTCQCCGCRGTSQNPLQCHHLTYKNLYNEDVYTDLVTICYSCHKGVHRLMERVTDPNGKKGWQDNPRIPDINTYTITGSDLHHRETF